MVSGSLFVAAVLLFSESSSAVFLIASQQAAGNVIVKRCELSGVVGSCGSEWALGQHSHTSYSSKSTM